VKFQYSEDDGKRVLMDNIFDPAIEEGVRDFFIYCNSLSGAFDFDTYALLKSIESGQDIRVYTPLQVYRKLGSSYDRIGVMAANNLSAHAIEEALMAANPDIYMIGTGNMAIVRAIEDGLSPEKIIEKCGISHLLRYAEACGAEAMVLGCTHFPYFRDSFKMYFGEDIDLIDGAEGTVNHLCRVVENMEYSNSKEKENVVYLQSGRTVKDQKTLDFYNLLERKIEYGFREDNFESMNIIE
jgi:glutamate racemase